MPTLLLDDKHTLDFKFSEFGLFNTGIFVGSLARGRSKQHLKYSKFRELFLEKYFLENDLIDVKL